jgi:hypothetical protein
MRRLPPPFSLLLLELEPRRWLADDLALSGAAAALAAGYRGAAAAAGIITGTPAAG